MGKEKTYWKAQQMKKDYGISFSPDGNKFVAVRVYPHLKGNSEIAAGQRFVV